MRRYSRGWKIMPIWKFNKTFVPKTKITIIIPARNEAENIQACLNSIVHQNYPTDLFEVIVIDDHSTDDTADIIRSYADQNIRLLQLADFVDESNTKSFKKRAIEIGVAHAKGDLIVGTDADCIVPENWLRHFAHYFEKTKAVFIAAPVNFHEEKNTLERFQSLDFIGMMGITAAGITGKFMHMCNGANLAYSKKAFNKIGGFKGIDHVASGDDMLLMQKMAKFYPNRIGFIKHPKQTVLTHAKPTWTSFLSQRLRWASKSSDYTEWQVAFYLAMVFFFCCTILFNVILLAFLGKAILYTLLVQVFIKMLMDFLLLYPTSQFFGRSDLMRSFFPSSFLHLLYIVIIGFLANFKKNYSWKDRVTK